MEHLDVLVVGAGLSGIAAGGHLQKTAPWASYAIFEAREDLGGTWDLFRYPGIRSDSDMFTLGFSFRPWDGKRSIAEGADILRYLRETASELGIDDKIRFRHKVLSADWRSDEAVWHVTAQRVDTGETFELTCGFLFSCSGYYRYDRGYLPDFEGMDRFAGTIIHPQAWPEDVDLAGKRVVVIGSGATAITLVPELARTAAHVTMLQRSPTYVMALPTVDPLANLLRRALPARWSGPLIRWQHALVTQGFYRLSRKRPALVKRMLRKGLDRQLPEGFDTDTHFTPTYDPWDQRLCVDANGALLRSIRDGSASVVTDRIATFTEHGIALESGDELEADVIVTATGLDLLFLGGIEASIDGEPVDLPSKLVYKGMMLQDVPNLAMAIGYTNASWTLKAELTCDYVARLLNHLRDTGTRACTPRNVDASTTPDPVLNLSSGYIQRAADRLPKQGSAFPWQVYQSYVADFRAMKRRPLVDGIMEFSNPVERAAATPVGEADGLALEAEAPAAVAPRAEVDPDVDPEPVPAG
jgi:cation diffusion facilitator CzcD-associated flavoprotein CzcO